ncbi:MAG: type II and III secretion system protein family protein [Rickettsiales bacterium]
MINTNRLFMFVMFCIAGASMAIAAEDYVRVEINKGRMVKLDRPANSVVVADPETADVQVVSPKLLFIHGRKIGETSIYAIDANDDTILNATVDVTHNISSLNRTVRRVAPDADVRFKTVDGGLVLDGHTSSVVESDHINNLAKAYVGEDDKVVNMMTAAGSDQVMLKVRIVEVTRSDVKRFGINLTALASPGGLGLQLLQGQGITLDGDGVLTRAGTSNVSSTTNTALYANWTPGNANISGVIDALEVQGLVNILAEPSLSTTSGKTANFLAGGEFPIPVQDGLGNITVTYKPFGVRLDFTPVVMSKDRMSITVAPEVSSINFDNPIEVNGIKNPIIQTRKAQATVELGSGDTFALAGLLRSDDANSIDKFPGLGDLPVLGSLFRSHNFRNDKTELVILVTPYLVRPVTEPKKMLTPWDGYVPPTDFQRLLLGNLYQQEPMDGWPEDAPGLTGEGGFILDE